MKNHNGQILTTTPFASWYVYHESLLWPETLMRIREICERQVEEEGTVHGDRIAPEIRKNKVAFINDEPTIYERC